MIKNPIAEWLEDIKFKYNFYRQAHKIYGSIDKKYIKDMQKLVQEVSKEADQISKVNHGGASPCPYKLSEL